MERLTNCDKEIPTLVDNAEYWLEAYFKLKKYEDLEEMTDNHICNCKRNNNSKDNEPCCKCDGEKTNIGMAEVNSLEIVVRMINNKPYYEVKYKEVGRDDYCIGYSSYNLKVVLGYIDTYFEIVASKETNADKIRNMSDEELAELITGGLKFDCTDYCDSFSNDCAFKCGGKDRTLALKWLQSEAE